MLAGALTARFVADADLRRLGRASCSKASTSAATL
jgi:hypothetical protein